MLNYSNLKRVAGTPPTQNCWQHFIHTHYKPFRKSASSDITSGYYLFVDLEHLRTMGLFRRKARSDLLFWSDALMFWSDARMFWSDALIWRSDLTLWSDALIWSSDLMLWSEVLIWCSDLMFCSDLMLYRSSVCGWWSSVWAAMCLMSVFRDTYSITLLCGAFPIQHRSL